MEDKKEFISTCFFFVIKNAFLPTLLSKLPELFCVGCGGKSNALVTQAGKLIFEWGKWEYVHSIG
jgi:hypothetical protein